MTQTLPRFRFRDVHPQVIIGTASDRYAGWLGQIYHREGYLNKMTARTKTVGGKMFNEEVLPVESVAEHFEHFPVLELDFTFYGLLLNSELKPTQTHRVLQAYGKHLGEADQVILKVPQIICARKLRRGGRFVENADYLQRDVFIRQFYEPAVALLNVAFIAVMMFAKWQDDYYLGKPLLSKTVTRKAGVWVRPLAPMRLKI